MPAKYLKMGYTTESQFSLTVGQEYSVLGMAVWNSSVLVLVADQNDWPNWIPTELFTVKDPRVPTGWLFATNVANQHGVEAIWGYELLITDPDHYELLLNGAAGALAAFRREAHSESQDREAIGI